jgi:hypothetical protein
VPGFAIETRTEEEAALVDEMRTRGATQAEIQTALDDSRSRRRVDTVIRETLERTGNFESDIQLTEDEAVEAIIRFVGDGYRELGIPGSGVYRSADGLRQGRMDDGSLLGRHRPREPHVHLEIFEHPSDPEPRANNHIRTLR